ncbi:hypothetical protein HK105_202787 [Polyrhizophydium stewartii]|uniref:UFSP1/2/DUB catalytic domain-containing protein n=1 Tax=Polyrhizophydium stewartii TaxID=2732419 RepID=A0ABR4NDH7_9FUNG
MQPNGTSSDGDWQYCPVCDFPFELRELEAHVESHFGGGGSGSSPTAGKRARRPSSPSPEPGASERQGHGGAVQQLSWIRVMTRLFERRMSLANSPTERVTLCHAGIEFPTRQRRENWACGYRNLQMLLSVALKMPAFAALHATLNGTPTVEQIQDMLHEAWQAGFDPEGAAQLEHQIRDTRKWIGTTDCAALLSYLGVPLQVYDVHQPSGPQRTHPRLVDMLLDYFERGEADASRVRHRADTLPVYLQHQGHSRIVVGVERLTSGEVNLLIFDPGRPLPERLVDLVLAPSLTHLDRVEAWRADAFLGHFRLPAKRLSQHLQYSLLRTMVLKWIERHLGGIPKSLADLKWIYRVNPNSTGSAPQASEFRVVAPGSQPPYKSPVPKKVAANYYFNRDVRRAYPQTVVFTPSELASLPSPAALSIGSGESAAQAAKAPGIVPIVPPIINNRYKYTPTAPHLAPDASNPEFSMRAVR